MWSGGDDEYRHHADHEAARVEGRYAKLSEPNPRNLVEMMPKKENRDDDWGLGRRLSVTTGG